MASSPYDNLDSMFDIDYRMAKKLQDLNEKNLVKLTTMRKRAMQELHSLEEKYLVDKTRARKEADTEWFAEYQKMIEDAEEKQKKAANDRLKDMNDLMLAMGATAEQIMNPDPGAVEARIKALKKERDQLLAATNDSKTTKRIQKEYAHKIKEEEKFSKRKQKAEEVIAKKAHADRLAKAKEIASETYKKPTDLFTKTTEARAAIIKANPALAGDPEAIEKELALARGEAIKNFASNYLDQLEAQGKSIAANQAAIDTRLQGSRSYGINGNFAWKELDKKIGKTVGVSPFVKQEAVVEDLKTLVARGISFNVEQRAFLQTISEKVATTFDAADSTLLKLVRIQQADTTAARLGMESALTSFLNNMYETTEYMTEAASSIRASLYEASALMEAERATAFEYQVQKWMGSLHSVGFSNTEGLSSAFGKLAAGDISGITDGGYGNLLVMAASAAGMSVADILEKGITDEETNELFESMVGYLAKIYEESRGSKVVMQQYANVYGLTASDLKAAANLSQSLPSISKNGLDYSGMLGQLNSMANTMVLRTSMGEMMDNVMENFTYNMAATMGNNPALFMTHEIAKMLKDTTGGINLPFLNVYGFGVDLNATVADLMEVAALSGTVLGGMGKLLGSLGSAGGFSGSGMLRQMGIGSGNAQHVTRGTGGLKLTSSGSTTSESGYIGNENADDVKSKTVSDAAAEPESQVAAAKEEMSDIKLEQVDEHVLDIYNLLLDVASGAKSLSVKLRIGDVPNSWSAAVWN